MTQTLFKIFIFLLVLSSGLGTKEDASVQNHRAPQSESPAYEIFQTQVYPFLQKQCSECHGENRFGAPQHSPHDDPKTSYKKILGYIQLEPNWEQTSKLISFGGIRHCQEYGGSDSCGANRKELISVVREWIEAEIKTSPVVKKSARNAKDMMPNEATAVAAEEHPSLKIIQVVAGSEHTCVLFENGKAKCWGGNGNGQLGLGTPESPIGKSFQEMQSLPYLPINEPIIQITANVDNTCVLLKNLKAKCWGSNWAGQLGIGTQKEFVGKKFEEMATLPYVLIPEPILQIAAGMSHVCALLINNKVKCWGSNMSGQLGIGSEKKDLGKTPEEMESLPNVLIEGHIVQISTASNHTCVLFSNFTAKCWGENLDGQLGIGSDKNFFGKTPQDMETLPNVLVAEQILQISAGSDHTCVMLSDHRAKCWGGNYNSQLGIALKVNKIGQTKQEMESLPYVLIPEQIAKMSLGQRHTCALLMDGKAKCWGYNYSAQLGIGTKAMNVGATEAEMAQLQTVAVENKILQIFASSDHSCFLMQNGKVKCTGENNKAQLGVGDTLSRGVYDLNGSGELEDAMVHAEKE